MSELAAKLRESFAPNREKSWRLTFAATGLKILHVRHVIAQQLVQSIAQYTLQMVHQTWNYTMPLRHDPGTTAQAPRQTGALGSVSALLLASFVTFGIRIRSFQTNYSM